MRAVKCAGQAGEEDEDYDEDDDDDEDLMPRALEVEDGPVRPGSVARWKWKEKIEKKSVFWKSKKRIPKAKWF